MTAMFTTTQLSGDRVLIEGTDKRDNTGEIVVDGSQLAALEARHAFDEATNEFDRAVDAHFKDLVEASDKLQATLNPVEKEDPSAFFELRPAVEGVEGRPAERVYFTHESRVLNLIADREYDRLLWVHGHLEILPA